MSSLVWLVYQTWMTRTAPVGISKVMLSTIAFMHVIISWFYLIWCQYDNRHNKEAMMTRICIIHWWRYKDNKRFILGFFTLMEPWLYFRGLITYMLASFTILDHSIKQAKSSCCTLSRDLDNIASYIHTAHTHIRSYALAYIWWKSYS